MSLLLTITAAPASISISESSKSFDLNGGTIGRGNENTWVLQDPERFLSSLHCQISNDSGQYYLTDMSTNGTFINGAVDPMGKGLKLPLNDGDKFTLGDYEFTVSLWNQAQMTPTSVANESMGSGGFAAPGTDDLMGSDPFSFSAENNDFGQHISHSSSPFNQGYISQSEPMFSVSPADTDPLLALDKAKGEEAFKNQDFSDPFVGASYSDQADPMNQQISWPETSLDTGGSIIPDDWDDDDLNPQQSTPAAQPVPQPVMNNNALPANPVPGKATTSAQLDDDEPPAVKSRVSKADIEVIQRKAMEIAMEKANAKVAVELKKLKKQMQSQKSNTDVRVAVDTSLVDTLGFNTQNLTEDEIVQINTKAGEVIRESIRGLMQVLSSRSAIKNEFRMNVTTIQPVENNPLKFSANVDDALENMFIKQGNTYKKPIEAIHEGFDSIAEHQVAIIAGIRAAFKGVIERFDPIRLEERFSKGSKAAGLIPGMQKAKNWDLYNDYYTDLAGDLDNSFQYLFGDEFVQAYEDQLRKLSVAKKSKSKDK